MNGNITKEGIKLDLEWMHRVGIAGFQNFDAALNTPQVVDHRLSYMTPGVERCLQVRHHTRPISWAWKRPLPARRDGANPAAHGFPLPRA